MASRSKRKQAYRRANPKPVRETVVETYRTFMPAHRPKLFKRVKYAVSDCVDEIKYQFDRFIDRIAPYEKCELVKLGTGTFAWSIPAAFYKCKHCELQYFTSILTNHGKLDLEYHSKCIRKGGINEKGFIERWRLRKQIRR